MATSRSELDPRKFLKDATAAARDLCIDRFEAFGCAGNGARNAMWYGSAPSTTRWMPALKSAVSASRG